MFNWGKVEFHHEPNGSGPKGLLKGSLTEERESFSCGLFVLFLASEPLPDGLNGSELKKLSVAFLLLGNVLWKGSIAKGSDLAGEDDKPLLIPAPDPLASALAGRSLLKGSPLNKSSPWEERESQSCRASVFSNGSPGKGSANETLL